MRHLQLVLLRAFGPIAALLVAGCSSSSAAPPGGGSDASTGQPDASADAADAAVPCSGPCPQSNVKFLIVLVQENHTFDDHFGGYCTATPGSNPTCNAGPSCCEAMPAKDPEGNSPVVLNDTALGGYDPDHLSSCEETEIDDGGMDLFVEAGCGHAGNIAAADPTIIKPLWDMAAGGALADRYFQPIVGESSSNDMYLARAQFVFLDNAAGPKGAAGMQCDVLEAAATQYTGTTIGDLLTQQTVPWTWFSDGYGAMQTAIAGGGCPTVPAACPAVIQGYPCLYDPSDVPFNYYASTVDNPETIKDLSVFYTLLSDGGLPAVSFVKAIGYESEHPGGGDTLTAGIGWISNVVAKVNASPYAAETLILVTYDEGGGYFDHVAPPPTSTVDNQPYGTRIPLVAIGPFAKKNYVSHVVMEHSSIVKFVEWNWLAGQTGQLKGRDATVANIGDMLDPAVTGVPVPAN